MVAVEAMALGRRRLWAGHLQAEETDTTQPLITDFFAPINPVQDHRTPADEAGAFAVGHLWSLLQDFVSVVDAPRSWADIGQDHPFVGWQSTHLVLNLPPQWALPHEL